MSYCPTQASGRSNVFFLARTLRLDAVLLLTLTGWRVSIGSGSTIGVSPCMCAYLQTQSFGSLKAWEGLSWMTPSTTWEVVSSTETSSSFSLEHVFLASLRWSVASSLSFPASVWRTPCTLSSYKQYDLGVDLSGTAVTPQSSQIPCPRWISHMAWFPQLWQLTRPVSTGLLSHKCRPHGFYCWRLENTLSHLINQNC